MTRGDWDMTEGDRVTGGDRDMTKGSQGRQWSEGVTGVGHSRSVDGQFLDAVIAMPVVIHIRMTLQGHSHRGRLQELAKFAAQHPVDLTGSTFQKIKDDPAGRVRDRGVGSVKGRSNTKSLTQNHVYIIL